MTRLWVWGLVVLGTFGCTAVGAEPSASADRCEASEVRITDGPIAGVPWVQDGDVSAALFYLSSDDVVDGTARIPSAERPSIRSNKVLWVLEEVGRGPLAVQGDRLDGEGSFTTITNATTSPGHYSSTVEVPTPGCWRIDVTGEKASSSFTFLSTS